MGVRTPPPPNCPKFVGYFYQNSNKTTFGRVSAALLQPQNPLLWLFLASKPPPQVISGYAPAVRSFMHLKNLHVSLVDYRWHFACGYSMVTSSHLSVTHFQFHNVSWQNNLFKLLQLLWLIVSYGAFRVLGYQFDSGQNNFKPPTPPLKSY